MKDGLKNLGVLGCSETMPIDLRSMPNGNQRGNRLTSDVFRGNWVAVWLSGNALVAINKLLYARPG